MIRKIFILTFFFIFVTTKAAIRQKLYGSHYKQRLQQQQQAQDNMEGYIVGGKLARIEEFPHSAFLAIACAKVTGTEGFACGSSILTQVILLTAAHCFEECAQIPQSKVTASVGGAHKQYDLRYKVEMFKSHPLYDMVQMKNDIALAKLASPVRFSKTVQRVVLTRSPSLYTEPAVLAGWGVTNEQYNTDTIYLKYAPQQIWSRQKCLNVLPAMDKGFICAQGIKEKSDYGYAAVGDSGSALIVRGYIQVGVVSHKITEYSVSLIVYSDVPYYYDWITSTAKQLYCRPYQ